MLGHGRRTQIQRPRGGKDATSTLDGAQDEQAMGVDRSIGFAGGLAVLTSFAAVACGRLSAHSATYHAMNLTGAVAMVAAGLPADAWPSVTVKGSWALISAYGLARAATVARPVREPLTDEHLVPAL